MPKPLREITGPPPFGKHPRRIDTIEPKPDLYIPNNPRFNLASMMRKRKKRTIITPIDFHPKISNVLASQMTLAAQTLKNRLKKKRRTINLPAGVMDKDSSPFPDESRSISERYEDCKFVVRWLHEIRKENIQKKVAACKSAIPRRNKTN